MPVGAAWLRVFSGRELGPWDDPGTPVLAIAVEPLSRGVGVGRLLMTALIEVAIPRASRPSTSLPARSMRWPCTSTNPAALEMLPNKAKP